MQIDEGMRFGAKFVLRVIDGAECLKWRRIQEFDEIAQKGDNLGSYLLRPRLREVSFEGAGTNFDE
jgi:hypothetical protein